MSRTLLTLIVVVFVVLCQPKPAEAAFWAWLEKWSGPGPFRGHTYLFTMCVQDVPESPVETKADVPAVLRTGKTLALQPSPIAMSNTFHQTRREVARRINLARTAGPDPRVFESLLANPEFTTWASLDPNMLAPLVTTRLSEMPEGTESLVRTLGAIYTDPRTTVGPGHTHERLVCGYFDVGLFDADADQQRGFPELVARVYDLGPSARIHDGVDIGGGFGWVRFKGTGVDFKKGAFTPLRIVLRPLLIAMPEDLRQSWMGVFSFYWKETYVWGHLASEDFGGRRGEWAENGEFIRSFGLNIDLTALLPTKWNLRFRRAGTP